MTNEASFSEGLLKHQHSALRLSLNESQTSFTHPFHKELVHHVSWPPSPHPDKGRISMGKSTVMNLVSGLTGWWWIGNDSKASWFIPTCYLPAELKSFKYNPSWVFIVYTNHFLGGELWGKKQQKRRERFFHQKAITCLSHLVDLSHLVENQITISRHSAFLEQCLCHYAC